MIPVPKVTTIRLINGWEDLCMFWFQAWSSCRERLSPSSHDANSKQCLGGKIWETLHALSQHFEAKKVSESGEILGNLALLSNFLNYTSKCVTGHTKSLNFSHSISLTLMCTVPDWVDTICFLFKSTFKWRFKKSYKDLIESWNFQEWHSLQISKIPLLNTVKNQENLLQTSPPGYWRSVCEYSSLQYYHMKGESWACEGHLAWPRQEY